MKTQITGVCQKVTLTLPVMLLKVTLTLPVILLKVTLTLPVIDETFASLNFETTDLFTDNFELKFEAFMFIIIYGFLLLSMIQICTAFSGEFKILS